MKYDSAVPDDQQPHQDAAYRRLDELLARIYGNKLPDGFTGRLQALIASVHIPTRSFAASQSDAIVIAFADHVQQAGRPSLAVLHDFCRQYANGLVNTVHVLPHYPSNGDRGFSVSDYLAVDPAFGTWQDVQALGRDFSLMLDAVINHTSSEHAWFKGFLAGEQRYRDYYLEFPPDTDLSTTTRPRTHPLLTPFESADGTKYVWTHFSAVQADLNYGNPEVLYDIVKVLLAYVEYGADLLRLDAVGFIWKELGTTSLHLPQAHAIIKLFREIMRQAAPWVWLVTETNVPHAENIAYFGNGHDEARMIYNFALPPLVVHSLQTGNAATLTSWAATLAKPSDDCHYFNFTASHDGIGVRGVTGILTADEIETMCQEVLRRGGRLSMKANSDGSQSVYEMNISYFNAVSQPGASLASRVDQFICSQAIALSLQGVPGIYFHSLVGSENWPQGVEQTGQNRTINEEKLQFDKLTQELQDPGHQRKLVYDRYAQLLKIRAAEPAFSPLADQEILDYGPEVFAVRRQSASGCIVALHNVSGRQHALDIGVRGTDLISGVEIDGSVTLPPYAVSWIRTVV